MASRLCVKNLPKNITDSKLKEIFSTKGEVTDVRLVKSNGKARLFGFVGYRTESDAKVAESYFNNSFIGTVRISVEFAKKIGDKTVLENARSKHTKKKLQDSKTDESSKRSGNTISIVSSQNSNPTDGSKAKLDFLEVMKTRRVAQKWANDEDIQTRLEQPSATKSATEYLNDSDNEYEIRQSNNQICTESVVTIPAKPNAGSLTNKNGATMGTNQIPSSMVFLRSKIKMDFSDDEDSDADDADGVLVNDNTFDDEISQSALPSTSQSKETKTRHKELNISKTVRTQSDTIISANVISDGNNQVDEKIKSTEQLFANLDGSGRLFVRNLSFGCTEEELTTLFSTYGPISEVHVSLDKDKKSKGYGFIQFMIPEHATIALANTDGTSFQGRLLHVIEAKEKRSHYDYENELSSSSHLSEFKQQKEKDRRSKALMKDSWNSAYVRSEAVVATLAEKYGVSTGDIMDAKESGGELAVRLAIGESQVVTDNRSFLAERGVDISALESARSSDKAAQRSTTTILVKNLPHDSDSHELESLFSRFGSISTFIMPPSRAVALVEFSEPSDARSAFKSLAYRKYKHLPLYLEWAPCNIIQKDKIQTKFATLNTGDNRSVKPNDSPDSTGNQPDLDEKKVTEQEVDNSDFSTLYIKNINFQSSEEDLFAHLKHLGAQGLRAVSIPKKVKGAVKLSMGFGFAEFASFAHASQALKVIGNSVLHGHSLEVKPSDKRLTAVPISQSLLEANGKPSNKLLVRNVAFQTTQSELRALFSTFGSVKRVRIPKKMGGEHRGFAFVDMASSQEARNAMDALSSAHLYGRHLVIEWSKPEDDSSIRGLDRLRKRARTDERIVSGGGRTHREDTRHSVDSQFNDMPSMSDLV